MAQVKIVTDSTADLPEKLRREYDIKIVPLKVIFGESIYRDGYDLTNREFYSKLAEATVLPTTSQPSPGEFLDTYQTLDQEGHPIVSIHLSSALSGTYQSALLASQMADLDIEVIDTKSASMGIGLIVLEAAKAARAGKTKEEIVSLVRDLADRMQIVFTLDTLEYLEKGGRIGKAQAFLGSLLNIKPILGIKDGVVVPVGKARGMGKAIETIVEMVREQVPAGKKIYGCFLHSNNEANLLKLKDKLADMCDDLLLAELGPVIGTHAGPGVVGLAFYFK